MTVTVLTPPGTGAIATVRVAGAGAWDAVRERFRPAGSKPLPELPELHRVWFGVLGDGGDEVVTGVEQVEPEPVIDLHCHGGRVVVKWVLGLFGEGGERRDASPPVLQAVPAELLPHAPTLRTAAVLLDQLHGAFARAVAECLEDLSLLPRLAALAPVGRHLVDPWRVVLAGPPNVGKSSLVNALAGFERSVVAAVAGTTRDVVAVRVAFDGWPVELNDTAGLRDAGEELEAEGIARTKARVESADLVVWVMDTTSEEPEWPPTDFAARLLLVVNKSDQPCHWHPKNVGDAWHILRVSAVTGAGVPLLIGEIVRRLVTVAPRPGEGVPYTPALADWVEAAAATLAAGNPDAALKLLREGLG